MRRLICALLVAAGCGGGGGDGSGATYFVRTSGSDQNNGQSPSAAFASIARGASVLRAGDRLIVGPGTYVERGIDTRGGRADAPVLILADPKGELTGDPPGSVELVSTGMTGFLISGGTYVEIDGFTVRGASGEDAAGIVIRNESNHAVVRNCEVTANLGDGIRVQSSSDVLLVNNLIHHNSGNGIRIAGNPGSPRAQIIHNTVARNGGRGIFIGSSRAASPGAFLRNNIIQGNGEFNLQVTDDPFDSLEGFDSGFNLVFPPRYRPQVVMATTDIQADASFVDATAGDFHLLQGGAVRSPALDRGDESIARDLRSALLDRSTAVSGERDSPPLDLGYHYGP